MATLSEIRAAMTGFPRTLTWGNFRTVTASPSPPHTAQASASFTMSGWSVRLANGEYRVHGARVTVALNSADSWATAAARTSQPLLRHEQGHYDITGLIARDLIRSVLNLSYDAAVVEVLRDAGSTANDRMRYVQRSFQADIDRLGREARTLLARLNTDPATGRDGLYDTQTNHSQNTARQQAWNDRLSRAKADDVSFGLHLMMEGVI